MEVAGADTDRQQRLVGADLLERAVDLQSDARLQQHLLVSCAVNSTLSSETAALGHCPNRAP
jgi:hypothetical protein